MAVRTKHESVPEIVRLLLEKGADITQPDLDEYPFLYCAVEKRNESALEIIRLLVKKGADIVLNVGKKT